MTAALIDGKSFAAGLRARVAAYVPAFHAASGRTPGLAVVLVGEDPASAVYVRSRARRRARRGWRASSTACPPTPARPS